MGPSRLLGALAAASVAAALAAAGCGGEGRAPARPPGEADTVVAARERGGGRADEGAAGTEASGVGEASGSREGGAVGGVAAPGADLSQVVRAPRMDEDVVLIDVLEVQQKLQQGARLLLIDARPRLEFEQEHIPGAVNIPLAKLATAAEVQGVPRDHEIVVYCIAATCPISKNAARVLGQLGFTNVKDMREGLLGWKRAGFETVARRG